MKPSNECPDIGQCDCLCEVVFYPSMEEGLRMCWWPVCASQKTITDNKLWFDIRAGRTYQGARR